MGEPSSSSSSSGPPAEAERQEKEPREAFGKWLKITSNTKSRHYFYNTKTEECQWVRPEEWPCDVEGLMLQEGMVIGNWKYYVDEKGLCCFLNLETKKSQTQIPKAYSDYEKWHRREEELLARQIREHCESDSEEDEAQRRVRSASEERDIQIEAEEARAREERWEADRWAGIAARTRRANERIRQQEQQKAWYAQERARQQAHQQAHFQWLREQMERDLQWSWEQERRALERHAAYVRDAQQRWGNEQELDVEEEEERAVRRARAQAQEPEAQVQEPEAQAPAQGEPLENDETDDDDDDE